MIIDGQIARLGSVDPHIWLMKLVIVIDSSKKMVATITFVGVPDIFELVTIAVGLLFLDDG